MKPAAKQAKKGKKSPTQKFQALAQRQVPKEGAAQRLALLHSRYLNSVLDPMAVVGAKIPDEITIPSFTTQLVTKFTLAAQNPGGTGPIGIGMSKVVGCIATAFASGGGAGSSGAFAQLVPNGSGSYVTTTFAGVWPGGTTVDGISMMQRPVSAALYVEIQGTALSNQGRIIIGFSPGFDSLAQTAFLGQPVSSALALSATYVTEVTVSKTPIARVIYLPTDTISRAYCPPANNTLTSARGSSPSFMYGVLWAIYDGANATSLPVAEFTFVENYEVVPLNNQVNILNPQASHSDPLELAASANFLSSNPRVIVQQPAKMAAGGSVDAGMKQTRSEGPSFLDSVLGGIEKVAGTALKVAPMAAELLALL